MEAIYFVGVQADVDSYWRIHFYYVFSFIFTLWISGNTHRTALDSQSDHQLLKMECFLPHRNFRKWETIYKWNILGSGEYPNLLKFSSFVENHLWVKSNWYGKFSSHLWRVFFWNMLLSPNLSMYTNPAIPRKRRLLTHESCGWEVRGQSQLLSSFAACWAGCSPISFSYFPSRN